MAKKRYPDLVKATGYGDGAGLCGWNCRHSFFPVIEGIDEPTYTPEQLKNIDPPPIEYNGKTYTYYQATQQQRMMETAMRKTKRGIIAADAAGDKDTFTEKSVRLRRQKEKYKDFSDSAGLLMQNERAQVYGYGRSISAKATVAAKKAENKADSLKEPTKRGKSAASAKALTNTTYGAKIKQREDTKCGSKLFTEENHTKMLQHERILSGNKYETAIVYNSDGSIKFEKKGNNDSVTFTAAERKRMKGCVATHNHPNESVQSPEDIMMLRRAKLTEIRACNSKGSYVVTAPTKWSAEIDTLDKLREKYFDYYEAAMNKYKDIAAQEGKPLILYMRKADEDGLKDFCLHYSCWAARVGAMGAPTSFPPRHCKQWQMWQYSWCGTVPGINTAVDFDDCFVDYPAAIRSAGKNGYGKPVSEPTFTLSAGRTGVKKQEIDGLTAKLSNMGFSVKVTEE